MLAKKIKRLRGDEIDAVIDLVCRSHARVVDRELARNPTAIEAIRNDQQHNESNCQKRQSHLTISNLRPSESRLLSQAAEHYSRPALPAPNIALATFEQVVASDCFLDSVAALEGMPAEFGMEHVQNLDKNNPPFTQITLIESGNHGNIPLRLSSLSAGADVRKCRSGAPLPDYFPADFAPAESL